MIAAAVLAFGASTALGEGDDALGVSSPGDHAACALGVDDELLAAGLRRPHAGRVRGLGDPAAPRVAGAPDRATLLLSRAFEACARDLDGVLPGWRGRRVGLALGTSSGGMRTFERIVDASPSTPRPGWFEATYLGPLVASERPVAFEPSALVMGACASSTLALGLARAWLAEGACDVAIAGGFDALSVFVAAGFEALRATSAFAVPRPFRADRDGLVLGEGAALLALVRGDVARNTPVLGFVRGFGASCDAVHVTAPDRTGEGLARAARAALLDAGDDVGEKAVDVVSAHGTATVFNDAAEAQAIRAVLGEGPTPVHALKGSIGHTLGAAGAVETLSSLACLRAGILPASVGDGPVEPGLEVPIVSASRDLRVALKLSAAFGGANAALVLSKTWSPSRAGAISTATSTGEPSAAGPAPHGTSLSDVVALTADLDAAVDATMLAEKIGLPVDRLARTDELTRLTIAAVARLEGARRERGRSSLRGAGIVVGHGLATFDTNAIHQARIATAGAARAEPRRFPYTTPNACAGEAAIAFGLTGPAFAVGGGAHGGIEALAVASTLVSAGHADRIVVVAVDAAGEASRRAAPETRRGAVAFVVTREPGDGLVERASVRLAKMPAPRPLADPRSVAAHPALLELAAPAGARTELLATTPWGLSAAASIHWLKFGLFLESRFVQRC